MKVISTFSGIGGIDLAFSWAGFDIVAQVEIDEYCRKVLAKHAAEYWPNAKQYEDIFNVGKHNLPEADVIVGGFPCQDLSHAGKRAGLDAGTRSGLWWELARLISELRPRVILLENVAGIYTLGGTDVLGSLTEMGYDAIWLSLRAADVGAPHSRERWFCVAHDQSIRTQRADRNMGNQKQTTQGEARAHSSHRSKKTVAYTQRRRYSKSGYTNKSTRYVKRHSTINQQSGKAKFRKAQSKCEVLGNTTRKQRLQRHGTLRKPLTSARHRKAVSTRSGNYSAGRAKKLKSRLDRTSTRIPARMDRHNGRWPAPPGIQQYEYEPPRTIEGGVNRNARIKALGNAVVPQVVYPLAVTIREFLKEPTP